MTMLGTRVRDRVSGFQGIATGRFAYLNGCVRVEITAEKIKDGKILIEVIDENQLTKVDRQHQDNLAAGARHIRLLQDQVLRLDDMNAQLERKLDELREDGKT